MSTSLGAKFPLTDFDPELFRVEVVREPPDVRVLLYGEIDLSTVDLIKGVMEEVAGKPGPSVVLDLGGVTFFGVCALRSLIAAHNAVESNGGRLRICQPPPCARRLIDLARLDRVLDIG